MAGRPPPWTSPAATPSSAATAGSTSSQTPVASPGSDSTYSGASMAHSHHHTSHIEDRTTCTIPEDEEYPDTFFPVSTAQGPESTTMTPGSLRTDHLDPSSGSGPEGGSRGGVDNVVGSAATGAAGHVSGGSTGLASVGVDMGKSSLPLADRVRAMRGQVQIQQQQHQQQQPPESMTTDQAMAIGSYKADNLPKLDRLGSPERLQAEAIGQPQERYQDTQDQKLVQTQAPIGAAAAATGHIYPRAVGSPHGTRALEQVSVGVPPSQALAATQEANHYGSTNVSVPGNAPIHAGGAIMSGHVAGDMGITSTTASSAPVGQAVAVSSAKTHPAVTPGDGVGVDATQAQLTSTDMTSLELVPTLFKWTHGTTTGKVYLAGSFNEWRGKAPMEPTGDGDYELVVDLPPGTYLYRYVVDDAWRVDPNAPMISHYGQEHVVNVIEVRRPVFGTYQNPAKRGAESDDEEELNQAQASASATGDEGGYSTDFNFPSATYGFLVPPIEAYTKEPPKVPTQLVQNTILNDTLGDPTELEPPLHVAVNHLAVWSNLAASNTLQESKQSGANPIAEAAAASLAKLLAAASAATNVTAITERFQTGPHVAAESRFVTTVYYAPKHGASGAVSSSPPTNQQPSQSQDS